MDVLSRLWSAIVNDKKFGFAKVLLAFLIILFAIKGFQIVVRGNDEVVDTDIEVVNDEVNVLGDIVVSDEEIDISEGDSVIAGEVGDYTAEYVGESLSVVGGLGEDVTVTFTVRNTGGTTWLTSDQVAVNIVGSTSIFQHDSWYTDRRPVLVSESEVPVSGTTTLSLTIHLPEVSGSYQMPIVLSRENNGEFFRVSGTYLSIPIIVVSADTVSVLGEQFFSSERMSSSAPSVGEVDSPDGVGTNTTTIPAVDSPSPSSGGGGVLFSVGVSGGGSGGGGASTQSTVPEEVSTTTSSTESEGDDITTTTEDIVETSNPIIISEVAWMGTKASSNDEWIELANIGLESVGLSGWVLRWGYDASTTEYARVVALDTVVISAGSAVIIERTDDETVRDISAALIYTGALKNSGEVIELVDADGMVVDVAGHVYGSWPAGDNIGRITMVRYATESDISTMSVSVGSAIESWCTWGTCDTGNVLEGNRSGLDADGGAIMGSPGAIGLRNAVEECEGDCVLADPEFDFGDAPHSGYGTTLAQDGARHIIVAGFFLGFSIDAEGDVVLGSDATDDDHAGIDDEDGVTFIVGGDRCDQSNLGSGKCILTPSGVYTVEVVVSGTGMLDAWIDWDGGGVFDSEDQIFASVPVTHGLNTLTFTVPADANSAGTVETFARFRLSKQGGLGPNGPADSGEVEDYQIGIYPPAKEENVDDIVVDDDTPGEGTEI
jgi:hypothetical protein